MRRTYITLTKKVKEGEYVPIKVPQVPIQLGYRKNTEEESVVIVDGKILYPETDYKIRNNLLYINAPLEAGTKIDLILF